MTIIIPDEKSDMTENGLMNIDLPLALTPDEERQIVMELTNIADSNLKHGNFYYLISNQWFMEWEKYTQQADGAFPYDDLSFVIPPDTVARPGSIDNSDIVEIGGCDEVDPQICRTLEEGRDYVMVPELVWEKLFKWYKGGPVLQRKMIAVGEQQKQFSVEVFPLCLRIIDSKNQNEECIRISKKASLRELNEQICRLKSLNPEEALIWDYFDKEKQTVLKPSDQTLEEANIQMDQDVLVEMQNDRSGVDSTETGMALVPVEPTRSLFSIAGGPTMSNANSNGSSTMYQSITSNPTYTEKVDSVFDVSKHTSGKVKGGLAGLRNLGNTCFMNSALQCLVHTPHLAEYFLKDYTHEINTENALGMHGELAVEFGRLLRKLWSSGQTSIAPREFKGKISHFAPQFCGYSQQDSQELIAFLLDGLHEDLNRVKHKPYIETKDSEGRPDEEVADELWRNHRSRNDSVIVDTCQGQYKSTLVCPVCNKISKTFDPFMYLSLPLPTITTRSITVTIFSGDGTGIPMPFTVTVLKQGCCRDLSEALGTACCLGSDEYLLLAEVYNHKIYRYLENPSEPLMKINDNDCIVAYRLPKKVAGLTKLEVYHRFQDKFNKFSIEGNLTPLVTVLDDLRFGEDIYRAVNRILSPLKKKMQYGPALQPADGMELDGVSSTEMSFRLHKDEGYYYGFREITKDSRIFPGRPIKVLLDWTDKEHESYDVNFLKDLPKVQAGDLAKKSKKAVSLFSCLESFLKEEPLGPDDMWYCPQCKEQKQASKKLDLWRLPEVLVVHLKRFSYTRWMKNKLDAFVDFPIQNLDLTEYVKNASAGSNVYELYAISNHYGGLGGGHYSAYCKLIDENRWYHFNDSYVSSVNESEITTSAAYLLFYRRVNTTTSETTVGELSGVNEAYISSPSASLFLGSTRIRNREEF